MGTRPTYEDLETKIISLENAVLEKERALKALGKEKEFSSSLVQCSPAFFVALNPEGRIIMMNEAMLTALGYNQAEVKGADYLSTFVPASEREPAARVFEELVRGKKATVNEGGVLTREGVQLLVKWHGRSILRDNGDLDFFFGLGIDITEQKKLHSQLIHSQKLEAIGTLAGGVAHDFNNLLQAIQGYSDLLLMDKPEADPDHRGLLEIRRAARRGGELTKQLLTFSRRVESKPAPVDLNNEIRDVRQLLNRTIPSMIQIELHLAEDLGRVRADANQLGQVIMNLVINARDAMPEGGKLIIETKNVLLDEHYCRTHLGASPGDYVCMTISDTGMGISRETLKHIFEPFYTTKEAGHGTGLGLAMVYGIVKGHGGYTMCYSEKGIGTSFKIYLPAISFKEDSKAPVSESIAAGRGETILLVDDNDPIRELGDQILSRFGYRVLCAQDGEDALELFRNSHEEVDLVVLDLIMPRMGGQECLEELLRINPLAKVVLSSGYPARAHAKRAMDAGAKGFISKPFEINQMLGLIRGLLDAN
jgi:PAS domain S-box-containing protein